MNLTISSAEIAPKVEPANVIPCTDWASVLLETAIEVFATMAHATVSARKDSAPQPEHLVTALVGIAGAIRAKIILKGRRESAAQLALQMIGIAPEDPGAAKAALDAFGEMGNILAGYFKAKVGLGDACKLSVPTIIAGGSYQFRSSGSFERIELSLQYEEEPLWLTLEVAR